MNSNELNTGENRGPSAGGRWLHPRMKLTVYFTVPQPRDWGGTRGD